MLKAYPPEEEDDAPVLDMAASRRTREGSNFGGDGNLGRYIDFWIRSGSNLYLYLIIKYVRFPSSTTILD
jgi:hypothetical protein